MPRKVESDGPKIIVQRMGSADMDELLKAAALLAEQDCTVLLGSETGKLVAAVGKSGLAKGLKAGAIIKAAAKLLGGGGGGKPDLAQGGGPDVAKLEDALAAGRYVLHAESGKYSVSGSDAKLIVTRKDGSREER